MPSWVRTATKFRCLHEGRGLLDTKMMKLDDLAANDFFDADITGMRA